MQSDPSRALIVAAVRAAPRRYRLPPLPAGIEAARAADDDTALAFAIEAARLGARGDALRALFTERLASLIRDALAEQGGDAAFRALVLQTRDADVQRYVRLDAHAAADRRSVRAVINAVAHPGKLRHEPAGARRDALMHLHQLTSADAWQTLAGALAALPPQLHDVRPSLAPLRESEPLRRLLEREALLALPAVRQYHALCELRGPLAGSHAAAAQGRAAARMGDAAEQVTVRVFREIARMLDAHGGGASQHRVVSSLRTPQGFPGEAGKAKDEWDAAIVRQDSPARPAHILLLAEVKAAPAAATPDYSRLQRGLDRLAQADAHRAYVFPCAEGEVSIAGASLRELRPQDRTLPPHVIYCCSAQPEAQPQMLSAASKAVLLAEPASLSFAQRVAQGGEPSADELAPVWTALTTAERLRSALHQYDTARAAREAMLRPEDLLAAIAAAS